MGSVLFYVYLADISTRILAISSILLGIFTVITILYMINCYEEEESINFKKIFKYALPFSIPLFIVLSFPSETTLYTLAAIKTGKEIEVSETVQKAINLINLKLDEALAEESK